MTAPRKEELRIAMAGRELESCQLVIVPDNGLTGKISVKWIPDGKMPVLMDWHEVTFVESARRAYPQLNEKTTSYPDPLVDVEDSAVVVRGKNIPLWLTFENPAGSVAGKFSVPGDGAVVFRVRPPGYQLEFLVHGQRATDCRWPF